MKGIPPEIDTLLWAVAEDESPRAGDEFVTRYPKYAGELARRRQMVQGLKGGRPTKAAAPRSRPAFRPAPVRTQPTPRRTLAGVGALLLAAIAVASYTIATFAKPEVKEAPPVPIVKKNPPRTEPDIQYQVPPVQNDPNLNAPNPPSQGNPSQSGPPRSERGQSFKIKGADLAGALAILGAEAGVQIIVAPGMGKRVIDAEYENVPLSEILKDLGHKFGFTPFDQGDGSIIIVPATESVTKRL